MDKFYEDLLLKLKVLKLAGPINQDSLVLIRDSLNLAGKNGIKELTLEIASEGGNSLPARKIFDLISNSPIKITGVVKPFAYSSAAVILQACHVRQAIRTATLLYHHLRKGSFCLSNYKLMTQKIVEEEIAFNKFIANRTKMSYKAFKLLNGHDIVLTAEQALSLGLIDEIIQPPPKQAPPQSDQKSKRLELFNDSEFLWNLRGYDELRIDGHPPIELIIVPKDISDNCLLYLYELLLHYPGQVTVTAARDVTEIAPLILLAGDIRQSYLNCDFLLREPFINIEGTTITQISKAPAQNLLKKRLLWANRFMKAEFLRRSKLTAQEYTQLLKSKFRFTAKAAIKYGLCQKIVIPKHLKK